MLATETAADDDGSGLKMREAHTTFRDVLMLSPLAAGAKHIDTTLSE
jgi:hypothetical protein